VKIATNTSTALVKAGATPVGQLTPVQSERLTKAYPGQVCVIDEAGTIHAMDRQGFQDLVSAGRLPARTGYLRDDRRVTLPTIWAPGGVRVVKTTNYAFHNMPYDVLFSQMGDQVTFDDDSIVGDMDSGAVSIDTLPKAVNIYPTDNSGTELLDGAIAYYAYLLELDRNNNINSPNVKFSLDQVVRGASTTDPTVVNRFEVDMGQLIKANIIVIGSRKLAEGESVMPRPIMAELDGTSTTPTQGDRWPRFTVTAMAVGAQFRARVARFDDPELLAFAELCQGLAGGDQIAIDQLCTYLPQVARLWTR